MNPFLWAVVTAFIWGGVPILEKLGLARVSPYVGLFYRCLGVLMGIGLLFFLDGKAIKASFAEFHGGMAYLIAGGFLASVVGQICFYHGLKSGEASRVVTVAAAYPFLTFILGVIFLSEKLTLGKAAGVVFVLAGVFLLK
jgi:bacterial/archaeal transporter family protein